MMHISYFLDKSKNHGIGLFAGENIQKGDLVYSASPVLDLNITENQFSELSDAEKKEVEYWGFPIREKGLWHVDFDVSKFINHSFDSTVTQDKEHDEGYLIATRDIEKGEELTQNYLEFESKEDLEKRGVKV